MSKIILYLTFALLPAQHLCAQIAGLLTSDERYQNVPLLPAYSGVKYTEVPVKVSLKKYCPVPGNQGKSGACVGWAVGYGALTIQRAIQGDVTEQDIITQQANSAAFIYNQVRLNKTDCTEGAYLEDALVLLQEKGDCLELSFNYEKLDCQIQPGVHHLEESKLYKAQDFAAVFDLNEEPKNKIGKACKILATNTPLVVGIGVTKSFFEVLPGAVSWAPAPSEAVTGYHAMVLVGYNSVEKYFDLLNSFGPSWGQNGFIRVTFKDFERLCRYAYVIIPAAHPITTLSSKYSQTTIQMPIENPKDEQRVLSGSFVFRQPAGFVQNDVGEEFMYFEEIKTRKSSLGPGAYETEKSVFEVGDVFQLVAREIPRGRYVYVFSQSADGTLNQHFPRKKDAVASAGFVLEKTVEIVIPGEESLLQLPLPGEDFLCILYSQAPIPGFEERLSSYKSSKDDFIQHTNRVFADVLIKAPNVQFSPEKMAFTALSDPDTGRIAAALMLKVRAE